MLWHANPTVNKKCFGMQKCLSKIEDFVCRRKCSEFTGNTYADEEVTLDRDVIKKVAKFLYLGDVLTSGVQGAVIARIRCEWKKFKDIASELV